MSDAVDPKTTALLLMDFQTVIVEGNLPERKDALLDRALALRSAARKTGVFVGYVMVAFRPGYPEVSPDNTAFAGLQAARMLVLDQPGTEIMPDIAPGPGEPVFVKKRFGAFAGTDLEVVLRARGVRTLILAGVSTSGVVLSTLRLAADLDFRILVAEDACADRDEETHRVLMTKVFPRQAEVMSAHEVIGRMG